MRIKAFVLTFIAYVFMHALRTGYSYAKPYFKTQYNLSSPFLAVLDASIYLFMGVGFALRYLFIDEKNLIRSYFITGMIFSISFALFPLGSILDAFNQQDIGPIALILMALFGFFQMNCWPISVNILYDYFQAQKDGTLIGLWTASGSIGNIVGYLVPSLVILRLLLPWQIPLLIFCGLSIAGTTGVQLFVRKRQQISSENYIQVKQQAEQPPITTSQLLTTFFQIMSNLDEGLLIINSCLLKSIIYTFLLWLPSYLDGIGHKEDSASIPIIFNIANTIGSIALGSLYEKSSNSENRNEKISQYMKVQYVFCFMALLIFFGLVFEQFLVSYSFIVFSIIISVEGFAAGGLFNMFASNQLHRLYGKNERKIDLYTSILFATSSFSFGLVELIIGLYMNSVPEKQSHRAVFLVLLILSIITLVLVCLRCWVVRRKITEVNDF